jgi:tetratricopeptide (TPR) repeat protein
MAKGKINVSKSTAQEDTLIDISEVGNSTQQFFDKYKTFLLGLGIGLVAVFAGSYAYKNFVQIPGKEKAVAAIYKAEQMVEKDSFASALTNPGGGFAGLEDVIKKHGGNANVAKYYAAIANMKLGKFDEAIKDMDGFSAAGSIAPTMKAGVLGDCYSEKKEFAKALSYYKQAADAGNVDDLKAYYLKKHGLLSLVQNDAAGALASFKAIKEKFPMSNEARDIDKYIVRAETK